MENLLYLLDNFSAPFLFILVFLVEAGIPVPIPYDILILGAGYRQVNFFHIALAVVSGNLAGSTILYLISSKLGHPALRRSIKFLNIPEKRLNLVQSWFDLWGGFAIVLARLVPGLRFIATMLSGAFSIPYFKVFLPHLFLGSIIWVSLYWILGALVGDSINLLIQVLGIWSALLTIVVILLGVIVAVGIYKKKYDKRSASN